MAKNVKDSLNLEREYAQTVLLRYLNGKPILDDSKYPTFFMDELSMNNLKRIHKKLIEKKFLTAAGDGTYGLTEKGVRWLTKRKEYLKFFDAAVPYVTIRDFVTERNRSSADADFDAVMLETIRKVGKGYRSRQEYPTVRNVFEDLGDYLYKRGEKGYALHQYLSALYYDFSGVDLYPAFLMYMSKEIGKEDLLKAYRYVAVSERMIARIQALKDYYDELMVPAVFSIEKTDINLFHVDEFKELVESIMAGTYNETVWKTKMDKNFKNVIKVADSYRKRVV